MPHCFRIIVLSSCLCFLTFVSFSHAGLLAGASKVTIVPPFPTHMGGFGDRMQTFEGVHDEVYARALALSDGTTNLILIGTDMMALQDELVRLARISIEKETGVPADHILISSAHNHSSPSYYQKVRKGEAHPPLEGYLVKQFTQAAVEAFANRVPARAGFRAGELRGASSNRQQGNQDVIDPQVGVLRVEEAEGRKVIAVLYNFTAHPVILGSRNLLLSGEYPGQASRTIEEAIGGVAIFTQGACGDVTIHRSGDPFLEIVRVGNVLAGEVIKTAAFIRGTEDVRLGAASKKLALEPKAIPPRAEVEKSLALNEQKLEAMESQGGQSQIERQLKNKIRLEKALITQAKAREKGTADVPDHYDAEVQVLRIGDVIFVAVPGELFVEYALEMRHRVGQTLDKSLVLVGYANGYLGYIVTPRAMETGGYEASVARVAVESGRRIIEAAMELVAEGNIRF